MPSTRGRTPKPIRRMDTEIMSDKRTQRRRARGDEVRYAITSALEEHEEELEGDWQDGE